MTSYLSLEQIRELIRPIEGPLGRGRSDADVVIVGAGPIGLTAANILGSLGISTILLEQNHLTSDLPRALAVDDEYVRLLDNLQILPSLQEHMSQPFGIFFYSSVGSPVVKVQPFFTSNGFGNRNGVMQPVFEKVLLAGAQRFDCVDLQYRSTVTGLGQDSEGVRLSVRTSSGVERTVTARYVLGCDGARSFVRSELGLSFKGKRIDEPHLVIDLAEFPDQSPYSRFFCNPRRPLNSIPTPYGGRRLEFKLNSNDDRAAIASNQSIRDLLDRYSPYKDVEAKVIRAVVYGFSERIAEHFQHRRGFLLGDAAHVMPPFGAQAMNTGARDANNICWKIAAVLAGKIGRDILETYESERRPQVEAIVRYSTTIGKLANIRSRPIALLRDVAFWGLNCIPSIRRFFAEMRYMPKPWLERGFLVHEGDRALSPVGRTFPRLSLATDEGCTLSIDAVAGNNFSLVGIGLPAAQVKESAAHALCRALNVRQIAIGLDEATPGDADGVTVGRLVSEEQRKWLQPHHLGKVFLIRPDRYVAAAAGFEESGRVFDQLQRSFVSSQQSALSTASARIVKQSA